MGSGEKTRPLTHMLDLNMATYNVVESILDPSSQGLLNRLDELLVDCTPLETEDPYGLDYAVRLEEIKKVSYTSYQ